MHLKKIVKDELIGLEAEVVASKNEADIGIRGKICDETKSTIVIEEKGRKKRLIKRNITMKIEYMGQMVKIDGKLVYGRPEDRIKRCRL